MIKRLVAIFCISTSLLLWACTANNAQSGNELYAQKGMEISKIASNMANSLYETMYENLTHSQEGVRDSYGRQIKEVKIPRVAIATFVDTDTLENAGHLGRTLAEVFVHELNRRSVEVVELKVTENLSLTKDGEFILSRNWKKLAKTAKVSHILTGTMTRNEDGVVLVARIINMQAHTVLGSATGFIPYSLLPYCYQTSQKGCSLDSVDGYRTKAELDAKKDYQQLLEDIKSGKVKAPYQSEEILYNKTKDNSVASSKQGVQRVVSSVSRADENRYPNKSVVGATSRGNYDDFVVEANEQSLFNRCFLSGCDSAVVYPAHSYKHNDLLVRDIADESQYDRMKNR